MNSHDFKRRTPLAGYSLRGSLFRPLATEVRQYCITCGTTALRERRSANGNTHIDQAPLRLRCHTNSTHTACHSSAALPYTLTHCAAIHTYPLRCHTHLPTALSYTLTHCAPMHTCPLHCHTRLPTTPSYTSLCSRLVASSRD